MFENIPQRKITYYFSMLIFVFLSCYFGYCTNRNQFILQLTLFTMLFAIMILEYKLKPEKNDFQIVLGVAILVRVLLLFMVPNLSDDFYRFIWDGQLIVNHTSPYHQTPYEWNQNISFVFPLKEELYEHLNNLQRSNHSCYLPLNQVFFAISAYLFPESITGNMIVLRLFIICAEIGSIYLGLQILRILKLPKRNILLYAFNPLVIFELTGNLHFEAIMIFFLLLSLYFLLNHKIGWSAIALALSVSMKVIPIILVPLFMKKLGFLKWLGYSSIILFTVLLLMVPIPLFNRIEGFTKSLSLYFQNFEFNASIYYLARTIGFYFKDYNMIDVLGPALSVAALLIILLLSLFQTNTKNKVLLSSLILGYSVFYFFSTTVHPWYITTIIALSTLSKYRFPVVWSLVIFLSYAAYSFQTFEENTYLLIIQYAIVYSILMYELFKNTKILRNLIL